MDISAHKLCPILTKLRAALWPRLVYLIKSLIVDSKTFDLKTLFPSQYNKKWMETPEFNK